MSALHQLLKLTLVFNFLKLIAIIYTLKLLFQPRHIPHIAFFGLVYNIHTLQYWRLSMYPSNNLALIKTIWIPVFGVMAHLVYHILFVVKKLAVLNKDIAVKILSYRKCAFCVLSNNT